MLGCRTHTHDRITGQKAFRHSIKKTKVRSSDENVTQENRSPLGKGMTKTTMRNYIENIGREMEHQTSTDPLLENFCICFTNHIGCVWVVLCGQNVPVNCFPLFHRDLKTEKRRRGQFRIVHPISRDGRAAQTHTHSHTHCNGHSLDIDETK